MSVTINVTFAGLAMAILHPEEDCSLAVLPDARKPAVLDDFTVGAEHQCYIRSPLAHFAHKDGGTLIADSSVVHRLGGDHVSMYLAVRRRGSEEFVPLAVESGAHGPANSGNALPMPYFDEIVTPTVAPLPQIINPTAHQSTLCRMVLPSGAWRGSGIQSQWIVSSALQTAPSVSNPCARTPIFGSYVGRMTWTRRIEDDITHVALMVHSLHGTNTPAASLVFAPLPAGGEETEVNMEIANLCADDPLEWKSNPRRRLADVDFKWMYSLLELPQQQRFTTALMGAELPHPRKVVQPGSMPGGIFAALGSEGCSTSALRHAFDTTAYLTMPVV